MQITLNGKTETFVADENDLYNLNSIWRRLGFEQNAHPEIMQHVHRKAIFESGDWRKSADGSNILATDIGLLMYLSEVSPTLGLGIIQSFTKLVNGEEHGAVEATRRITLNN